MSKLPTTAALMLLCALAPPGVAFAQTTTTEPAVEPAEDLAAPVEGQIETQNMNTLLVTQLLGATVYAPDDGTVGEISDMIVTMDGSVEGIVIGVGGLLGLGEKDVAVELSALEVRVTPENEPRLVLNVTTADLEAAPAFTSAQDQLMEADAEAARTEMQNATPAVGTTPAPLDPAMAPANPAAAPAGTAAPAQ